MCGKRWPHRVFSSLTFFPKMHLRAVTQAQVCSLEGIPGSRWGDSEHSVRTDHGVCRQDVQPAPDPVPEGASRAPRGVYTLHDGGAGRNLIKDAALNVSGFNNANTGFPVSDADPHPCGLTNRQGNAFNCNTTPARTGSTCRRHLQCSSDSDTLSPVTAL